MQKVLTGVLLNFDLFTSLHLQTLAKMPGQCTSSRLFTEGTAVES
jgi:hypothetical protein